MAEKKKKTCMDAALTYLTARMRSEKEMRQYLEKKEYEPEEIAAVMERLKEYRYIDDQAFADEWIRTRTATKPIGKYALSQGLYRKGIDKQTIERSLQSYDAADEHTACEALCKKLINKHGTDRAALMKVQRALLTRGFSYDTMRNALAHVKDVDWE